MKSAYRLHELAELTGLKHKTIASRVYRGHVRSFRGADGHRYVPIEDVREAGWLDENTQTRGTRVANNIELPEVNDLLKQVKDPLNQARDALEQRKLELRSELNGVEEEIKRIDKTLRTIDPPTTRKVKTVRSGSVGVSRETVEAVYAKIVERGEGTITELANELDLSGPSVSAAIRNLRGEERVRLAGRRGMSQLFKPMEEPDQAPYSANGNGDQQEAEATA